MRPTVATAVSSRPVDQGGVLPWINREAQPLLRELREGANQHGSERKTAVTAGAGAYVTIWTSAELATNGTWNITADVVGVTTSGAAQRAGYLLIGTFESTSSTVAQVGTTTSLHSAESTANINARFATDGTARTVYLEVRDDATSPMRFTAVVWVNEGLTA